MPTTVTVESFRSSFPAFADEAIYTDDNIQMWLTASPNFFNERRWKSSLDLGTSLWLAHNLTLDARSNQAAMNGGDAGEVTGPTSAQGVDKVTVSYDTNAVALKNAGDYALTTWGLRFLRLARTIGAGPSYRR